MSKNKTKKRFTPIMYIIILGTLYCVIPTLISVILWYFVDCTSLNVTSSLLAGLLTIGFPVVLYYNRESASVVITETTIENYMNDNTDYMWVEEIVNLKSVKRTTGKECRQYYKGCKAKKVILLDFGNGNIKYIASGLFTRKEEKKIVEAIESRRQAL